MTAFLSSLSSAPRAGYFRKRVRSRGKRPRPPVQSAIKANKEKIPICTCSPFRCLLFADSEMELAFPRGKRTYCPAWDNRKTALCIATGQKMTENTVFFLFCDGPTLSHEFLNFLSLRSGFLLAEWTMICVAFERKVTSFRRVRVISNIWSTPHLEQRPPLGTLQRTLRAWMRMRVGASACPG